MNVPTLSQIVTLCYLMILYRQNIYCFSSIELKFDIVELAFSLVLHLVLIISNLKIELVSNNFVFLLSRIWFLFFTIDIVDFCITAMFVLVKKWLSNKNVGEPVHYLNICSHSQLYIRQAAVNPLQQIILKYKLENAFEEKKSAAI